MDYDDIFELNTSPFWLSGACNPGSKRGGGLLGETDSGHAREAFELVRSGLESILHDQ